MRLQGLETNVTKEIGRERVKDTGEGSGHNISIK